MWVWGDSRSRYWFLGLSLLGGWISRECAGCALPFSWPARLVCSLGMPAGVRGEDAGISGVGRWGGGGLLDPHEVWTRRKGGCSCYSVVELWMTLRTGSGWRKKSGEYLPIHRQGSLLGLLEGTACGWAVGVHPSWGLGRSSREGEVSRVWFVESTEGVWWGLQLVFCWSIRNGPEDSVWKNRELLWDFNLRFFCFLRFFFPLREGPNSNGHGMKET